MNAPNPSSDRDLEALRRAQRAHEPSMEEILASIRSIIADDREPAAASPPAPKPAAPSGPQIVYANDSIPLRPVAPPPAQTAPAQTTPAAVSPPQAPPAAPPPAPAAAAAPSPPKVVWEKPEPAAEPIETMPERVEDEPFASPETEAAVAASFNALSTSVAMQSSEMIEGMVRDMLRPMLKSWLDDNLPSLVERLVRAEIQRVARGGR